MDKINFKPTVYPAAMPRPVKAAGLADSAPLERVTLSRKKPQGEINSLEFKLELKPDGFSRQGISRLQSQIEESASNSGLSFKSKKHPKNHPGTVFYLDTPDQRLHKMGYILRVRQDEGKNPELTLKFRDSELKKAAGVDLQANPESKSKFEKDVTAGIGGFKNLYSKSSDAQVSGIPGKRLADFSEIFPALARLGISPDSQLAPVNNKIIREETYRLGKLHLGGKEIKSSLELWYLKDKPLAAEFSFHCQNQPQLEKTAEKFLRAIISRAGSTLGAGADKTGLVYQ